MAESTELAVIETSHALAGYLPGCTPAEAREAMERYQAICTAALSEEDYQSYEQYDPKTRTKKTARFKKKSAVKKLQTFWQVSVHLRETVRDDLGGGEFGFRVTAVARAANGREVEACGGCSSLEERFNPERRTYVWENGRKINRLEPEEAWAARIRSARARMYNDILGTAETRATNRAVMNCIGVSGGEVTAEEADAGQRREPPPEPDADALAEQYAREQAKELPLEERLRRRIFALCGELGWDDSRRHEEQSLLLGSSSLNELNEEQLKRFGQHLAALKERK